MGMTNFPNGISSMGIPVLGGGGIPATFGTVYFVDYDNGDDGNSGKSLSQAFKTLAAAYAAVTTNKDDVIALAGYSAHPVSALLAVAKNRVHFVGLGQPSRASLQGTRVTMAASVSAQCMIRNTGSRNSFTNIKFVNSSTQTAAKYCIEEGGEGTVYEGCAIHMNARLDQTTTSDLLMGGDSCTFLNCTFGNDNLLTSAARAVVLIDPVTGGAECMKNSYFENCVFQVQSSEANAFLVKVNATSSLKFGNVLKNCTYLAIINGTNVAVALTNAVTSVASLVEGNILYINPATNCTNFSASNSTNTKVTGTPTATTNAFEGVVPA